MPVVYFQAAEIIIDHLDRVIRFLVTGLFEGGVYANEPTTSRSLREGKIKAASTIFDHDIRTETTEES